MKRSCGLCNNIFTEVPLLVCKCFICPPCYVKLKAENPKAKCPFGCNKLLRRAVSYS
jgi:hypothetical protein